MNFGYFLEIKPEFNEKINTKILNCSDFYYNAGQSVYSVFFDDIQNMISESVEKFNEEIDSKGVGFENSIVLLVNSTKPNALKHSLVREYQNELMNEYFSNNTEIKNKQMFVNDQRNLESHLFLLQLFEQRKIDTKQKK